VRGHERAAEAMKGELEAKKEEKKNYAIYSSVHYTVRSERHQVFSIKY
jgi:hypothetical protein